MYLQVITAVSTAALTFLTVRWAGARDKRGVSGGGGESTAAATAAVASGTSGAEHLVPPRRLTQRPRVLVMGFFDMLHHGHIAFLKCAAKFGDVVVVVGRDANHFARKNRYPIMGEQIRLVAVRELRVVTDAVLAKGLGLLDFEDNLAALRPIDAIFATQDNDRAEVEALCNERGIEYIVRPKPSLTAIFGVDLPEMHPKHIRASFEMAFRDSPGGGGAPSAMGMGIGMGGGGAGSANGAGGGAPLRLRTVSSSEHLLRLSSTSLSSQRSPHSPFSSPLRAPTTAPGATPPPSPGSTAAGAGGAGAAVSADDFPWRLCIGGGWLDQPWVSEKHAGACIVVNVLPNVNFRSHCGLATSTRKIGMLLWGGTAAGDGAAGRGRSARRGAGVGRAGGAPPPNTSCEERARLLFGACNPPYSDYVLGAGGSLGLMLPGINRLNFDGECVE
jgi:cytidyltransferase-like protein